MFFLILILLLLGKENLFTEEDFFGTLSVFSCCFEQFLSHKYRSGVDIEFPPSAQFRIQFLSVAFGSCFFSHPNRIFLTGRFRLFLEFDFRFCLSGRLDHKTNYTNVISLWLDTESDFFLAYYLCHYMPNFVKMMHSIAYGAFTTKSW